MANFFQNTAATFAARVAAAVFGLLATIVIARVLGPEGQGIFSLAILLPGTLFAFATLGVNVSATYFASKKKYPLPQIFAGSIFFSVILAALAVAAAWIIIALWQGQLFGGVPAMLLYAALALIPFNLALELFLPIVLGAQKIAGYNFLSLLQSFLFLILAFAAAAAFAGVGWFIAFQIISFALAAVAAFFYVFKLTGGKIEMPKAAYLKEALSYGTKNYLGGVIVLIHYRIDTVLVNYFINPLAVGLYYAATRVAESVWFVSQSASTMLFPRVAAESDEARLKEFTPTVCRNVLFITGLVCLCFWIFARSLITLFYSREFLAAAVPFQILLPGTFLVAGWKILANDIAARGKPMANTWIIAFSTVINVILNIYAIPAFGIAGAAWASTISYSVMFAATAILYKTVSKASLTDILFIKTADIKFYWNFLAAVVRQAQDSHRRS